MSDDWESLTSLCPAEAAIWGVPSATVTINEAVLLSLGLEPAAIFKAWEIEATSEVDLYALSTEVKRVPLAVFVGRSLPEALQRFDQAATAVRSGALVLETEEQGCPAKLKLESFAGWAVRMGWSLPDWLAELPSVGKRGRQRQRERTDERHAVWQRYLDELAAGSNPPVSHRQAAKLAEQVFQSRGALAASAKTIAQSTEWKGPRRRVSGER